MRILSSMFILSCMVFIHGVSAAEHPKKKRVDTYVAVFDLETQDVDKTIARPLTDSVRHALVISGKYDVIDRSNMDRILGEQAFQMTGCAASECVVEAGQLLGVGRIVTGSVSLVGKTYYLSLSLTNVQTGKIENISEDTCQCKVDDLIDSTKALVQKLLTDSPRTPGRNGVNELPRKEPRKDGDGNGTTVSGERMSDPKGTTTHKTNFQSGQDITINVAGNYTCHDNCVPGLEGAIARIQQSGNSLVFINERGDRSTGSFIDATTIIADQWGPLRATIESGGQELHWVNRTIWRRN